MQPDELDAREQIRDLVARYNANGDSGRIDAVLELFWPDAEMELGRGDEARRFHGHTEIRTIFTGAAQQWRPDPASGPGPAFHVRHLVSTHVIDLLDATRARGYAYFAVLMPHGLDHWGRYFDEYTARDGQWRFARRRVVTDGHRDG